MKKHYLVHADRHVTLPVGLLPAPGAMNMRVAAGQVVTLDDDDPRTKRYGRFIANRIKLGDFVEIDEAEATAAAKPAPTAPSSAKPAPFVTNPLPDGGK